MKTWMIAVVLLFVASGALGQSAVLTNYIDLNPFDDTNPLSTGNIVITAGMQFQHVVLLTNSAGDFVGWEFSTVALEVASPGVFNIGSSVYGDSNSGDVPGEYIVGLGICTSETGVELIRISYGAFGGAPATDLVVSVWGTEPSQFGGEPGITLCSGELFTAVQGGSDGGCSGSGVTWPDGALAINGTWGGWDCPAEEESLSQLKSHF